MFSNIAADLGGMADAMQMVTGIPSYYWTPFFALLVIALLFRTSYRAMARIFKWLTLVLFAYVFTAFLARPNWSAVLRATFIPHIEWTKAYLAVLVGILGTTISPYLFFWQAAQEVEVERAQGRTTLALRRGASDEELKDSTIDVIAGMFLSNLVMYFIILTTAATLHVTGLTR
jgi:Mn2+/Fe2+ NRAMP family transporter